MQNFPAHDNLLSVKNTLSAKRARKGMTLIEILIVVAIIGMITFPLLLTYRSYRTTQALSASAESVANHTTSVHIFAREAQKQREWGIKNKGDSTYVIYSTGASGIIEEQNYILDAGVSFEEDFDILFEIGTGKTENESVIKIVNINGHGIWVTVSENGVVEINTNP